MPRILVVGYNAFDVTVAVAGLPRPDTKLEVPPIRLGGGGPAATAAVALARLGAAVRLLSPLTDDEAGRLQRRELAAAGVDTGACPVLPGVESAKAVILVDPTDGSRTILWSRGGVPPLPPPADPAAALAGCDLLYVDGHEPAASVVLARQARRLGLPVVMDAGSVREGSRELVPLCTDVISSAVFAPAYTGRPEPAAALRALRAEGPARVAMTFGADGVLALAGGEPFAVPAFLVEAVDTTGAGDAFHAGYAFALAGGAAFAAALRWGAAETESFLAHGAVRPLGPRVAAAAAAL
ncbi:MAG: carbohydrate kinase family protein [Candidatus Krumholzibacteriia bacterium]